MTAAEKKEMKLSDTPRFSDKQKVRKVYEEDIKMANEPKNSDSKLRFDLFNVIVNPKPNS